MLKFDMKQVDKSQVSTVKRRDNEDDVSSVSLSPSLSD